ncbi:MAG: flagellar biosynthesis anti-sigma factor FlgM [Pseudomonadota bacterium]
MPNKINGTDSRPVQIAPSSPAPRLTGGNTPSKSESRTAPPGTDVQITNRAQQLAALEQSIRELPAIDASRVAAVRERLDSGNYQPDAQRVADGLIAMNAALDECR